MVSIKELQTRDLPSEVDRHLDTEETRSSIEKKPTLLYYLDDWLTVNRNMTLVDIQLDAQNSCLFTYNTFIKILYMFRSDCPVHRLRKKTVTCRQ